MKHFLLILLILFIQSVWAVKPPVRILVLGFDGLGGYAFKNRPPGTHFQEQINSGAYTFSALSVLPTVSSPNWASMINGGTPATHGVKGNGWKVSDASGRSFCGNPEGQIFPTIFRLAREKYPDIQMSCVHDWGDFARLTEPNVFTSIQHTSGENKTLKKVVKLIDDGMPDFLFVHFDHVDHAGHAFGHNTDKYFEAVSKADSITGVIIDALKKKGMYESTYILITADHGGKNKGHHGAHPQVREIPWILSGPGVRKGYKITSVVNQFDTAPTLAYLLGIIPPSCWSGKVIHDAFTE
jgi:predicted AlkP superfamily pyrophosphatase or phosphodiesterase